MKPILALTTLIGTSAALVLSSRDDSLIPNIRPAEHELSRTPPPHVAGHPQVLFPSGKHPGRRAARSIESTRGGALLSGSDVTSASGVFIVPAAQMPTSGPTANNANGLYSASFWIGIDGVTCSTAGVRAGVDIFWDGNLGTGSAAATYNAWYEYYPSPSVDFGGSFTVTAGDTVRITTSAGHANGSGSVVIDNFGPTAHGSTTGRVVHRASFSFKNQTTPLCKSEAVWAIEDDALASLPDTPVALVNFTSITFGQMSAKTSAGTVSNTGAKLMDIDLQDQGGKLTDCRIVNATGVSCARVVG
jgi:hypothetical protein